MDGTPLTIANNNLWNAVIIHIGDVNGADILGGGNRPAWKLAANVVRIDKLPTRSRNKLLIIFSRKRRELQVCSKPAAIRPLNSVRARINHHTVSRRDFYRWIVVHLPGNHIVATSACDLPE